MTRRRVIYDAQSLSSHDKYPILRIPERGTIVRSSRSGGASSRGPKEKIFEQAIIQHFWHTVVNSEVRTKLVLSSHAQQLTHHAMPHPK